MQLAAGVAGAAFLFMYFRVAEAKWPNSYFAAGDARSFRISRHPLRYVAFRFAPVAIVSYFMVAVLSNGGQPYIVAVLTFGALHLVLHIGSAVTNVATAAKTSLWDRPSLLVGYGLVVAGVVAAVPLGSLAGQHQQLQALVPPPSQLTASLWTGVFAAVAGAFLLRATQGGEITTDEMIAHVRSNVSGDIWRRADAAAAAHDADQLLVHAVLIGECLQRPSWIRRLERIKGRLLPAGTYGVMQAYADHPLTDEESVELAVQGKLAGITVPMDSGYPDQGSLRNIVSTYNRRTGFVDLVVDIYQTLYFEQEAAQQ